MEHGKRDTLLGLVFFGGLGLLIWATAELSNFSLHPKPTLDVYFTGAGGLRVGDPIFVRGVRSGKVQSVDYRPAYADNPILVRLELDEPITLHEDVLVTIVGASLLGGKQIEIDPGVAPQVHSGDRLLVGVNRATALDAMGDTLAGLDLQGAVRSLRTFFDRLTDPNSSVGALLATREAYDDFAATLRALRQSVEAVEKGQGTLGKIIHNEQLGSDVAAIASELRQVIHKSNEGAGVVSLLLNDEQLAVDVAGSVGGVRELIERAQRGEGVVGRMFADAELANRFTNIVTRLESVSAKLDDPNAGIVGAVLGDEVLLRDARTLVAGASEIIVRIRDGNGLLARLINDPELGERVDRLFAQVTRAIEDAREAAPIGTFFQVFAGPF